MAQFTEEEKMLRRIDKRFSKGVVEYGLIEDGDKILIGLSGGKDSLALVELLARRARIYKPRFSIVAVHVVMKNIPYQSDVDSVSYTHLRKLVIQENSDAVFRIGFLQGVSANLYNSSTDRASFITSSVSIFSKKSLTLVFIIPLR